MNPPTPAPLPRLRRRRRLLNLARLAKLVSKGVAEVDATVEPIARHWDDHNQRTLHETGPLWVALGDSVTQGVGTSDPEHSYPTRILSRLREETGEPWRLVNLSMSGGRFDDVRVRQLGALDQARLRPQLVTTLVGSNDVIWRRDTEAIVDDARALVDALPPGTVLSRVSERPPDRKRRGINQVFEAAETTGRVDLYDAWEWPTGEGMWAADRFHPNDRAHRHLADNLWGVLSTRGLA